MANFMYLFRGTAGNWQQPSPEEMERLTKAWMSWMDRLRTDGHLVKTGERLNGNGTVVRGKAKTVTDGPFAEAKDVVVGYLLLQAGDLAEAVELAKGCPNLESGGAVEVRPIVSMS
jgi:hypothetical protein